MVGIFIKFSPTFQASHVSQLGQGDISPKWNGRKTVFHSISGPTEELGTKTNGKAQNDQTSLAGRKKMTQFVYENREP